MEHYVIVLQDTVGESQNVRIIGVHHTLEEAKEDFKHMVWYVKDLSDGYNIVTDTDICFSAHLFGKRKMGYTCLYIEKVEASEERGVDYDL